MTRSEMGARRTFSRYRILVFSDPSWIHRILVAEEATCHSGIECFKHRVRKSKGERCSASEGVTAEDPEVQHGMTGWTNY